MVILVGTFCQTPVNTPSGTGLVQATTMDTLVGTWAWYEDKTHTSYPPSPKGIVNFMRFDSTGDFVFQPRNTYPHRAYSESLKTIPGFAYTTGKFAISETTLTLSDRYQPGGADSISGSCQFRFTLVPLDSNENHEILRSLFMKLELERLDSSFSFGGAQRKFDYYLLDR